MDPRPLYKHSLKRLAYEVSYAVSEPISIEELLGYIKQLSDKEQQIIDFYYRDGLVFREIANMLGVCTVRIWQLHQRAIRRMGNNVAAAKKREKWEIITSELLNH